MDSDNCFYGSQFGRDVRRKLKLEALVTSGCGKHKEKIRMVTGFWEKIWPLLEDVGWKKVHGTGRQEGSVLFIPDGIDPETATKNADYYDRIKAVLDRIMERRTPQESAIADIYEKEVLRDPEKEASAGKAENGAPRKRKAGGAESNKGAKKAKQGLDLSWKEGTRGFPKKMTPVGAEYQVDADKIPKAGSFQDAENEGSAVYCELLFDPKVASENAVDLEKYVGELPHNKKEEAICLIGASDYKLDGFKEALEKIEPCDGSNWSEERKDLYHREIFRLRKDLNALCLSMEIDMKTCLTYYLGTFKTSDNYRLLKTVCAEERLERQAAKEFDQGACAVCGEGGNLLICDACEGEYHMSCMRPALSRIPEGKWECDQCVDTKFLETRDYLIRNTSAFKKKIDQSEAENARTAPDDTSMYEPTEKVMEAVRKLARKIHGVLSSKSNADEISTQK